MVPVELLKQLALADAVKKVTTRKVGPEQHVPFLGHTASIEETAFLADTRHLHYWKLDPVLE